MFLGALSRLHSLQTADTGAPGGAADPPASAETKNTAADQPVEHMIPKARFDEINRELRELRKAQADADAARKAADEQALAEQGAYKTLAEQRAAELAAAQAQVEANKAVEKERDRYKDALHTHLDTLRTDLPAHILSLLDKLDAADQLEWIAANRAALTPEPAKPPARGDGVGSPAGGKRPVQGTTEMKSPGIRI